MSLFFTKNCSLYTLFIGLFLVIYLIFSNLSFCFSSKKIEIERHDNELKLQLPEDLMGNPLIKLLLQKIFYLFFSSFDYFIVFHGYFI